MLEIINLTKIYDSEVVAVSGLNLTVKEGEIFCMLGANGAGKTTTLMLTLGFTEPTEGTVKINGIDVTKNPLEAKKYVAYVSENVQLYGNFTAKQNLDFFAKLAGKNMTQSEYEKILDRVGLIREAHNRRVRGFSKGMRQRLGIAIAIAKDAKVILLDEPTSGLDPEGAMEFTKLLEELREEKKAILMTTHDIFRAKQIANHIGIMTRGKLVRVITKDEIEKEDLEALYIQYITQDEKTKGEKSVLPHL